ncbi:MAG: hypothetical protein JXA64_07405 [Candidatus Fermentibacteraceae bacterium]|nr:hypothetical protein [Candidatus Fermentibacteraceae bacterium]MBN2608927.1 hypothetical protein [Candidatus Fermentibacteraceae bacterium]
MKEFKVRPHESIGPARLGMTREDIRAALGIPSHIEAAHVKWGIRFPDKDCFYDNAFQVSYGGRMKAEFIEVSSRPDYTVTFDGVPVHGSPPETVVAAIRKHAEPDKADPEYPMNIFFPRLDLSLYREHSEEGRFDAISISTREYGKQRTG